MRLSRLRIVQRSVIVALLCIGARVGLAIDCNGNGVDDPDDFVNGFSTDCNENGIPDECDANPIAMVLGEESYPVPRFARVVKAADLDDDGDLDLITGGQATNADSVVSVLLNDGDGAFSSAGDLDVGEKLATVTVGDLDGDGDLDVATVNETHVAILLNEENGTFSAPDSYAVDAAAVFVTAADVTGDRVDDLITAHTSSDTISVLINQGDGSFGAPTSLPVGDYPNSVAAGDYDGDGDIDLAVSNRNAGNVSILLGGGDGGFSGAVNYGLGVSRPFAVVSDDFDADGDVDVAAATTTAVSVLLNNGDGAFGDPVIFQIAGSANSIDAVDIDADGDLDFVLGYSRSDQVALIRNDGSASFRALVQTQGNVPRSSSIVSGDYNGDGKPDFAMAGSDTISIVWGLGSDAKTVSFTPAAFSATAKPHTGDIGDIDGDGDLDVVTGNNTRENGMTVFENQGDGTFPARVGYTTEGTTFSLTLGDADGDGDLDAGALGGGGTAVVTRVELLKNDGQNVYSHAGSYTVGARPSHVEMGDLDGDGAVELIVCHGSASTLTVFFNNGDGTYNDGGTLIELGSGQGYSRAADLNGDGAVDLAVATGGAVSVLINQGGGNFESPVVYPVLGSPRTIAAGDVDQDGHVDLATANFGNKIVSVLWNRGSDDGSGIFDPAANFSVEFSPQSVSVGDMDGDGRFDIVTANAADHSASIVFFNADRSFDQSASFPVGQNPRHVFTGDYDADGDLEIVTANWGSVNITLLYNQTPMFTEDFLGTICTEVDFFNVSIGSTTGRVTKYVLPVRDDPALIKTAFQNVRRFSLHEDFLAGAFPEHFPTRPQGEEYDQLVGRRATRDYFVGALRRAVTESDIVYAFTVVADTGFSASEVLDQEEVRGVYSALKESFELEPLAYWPDTQLAREEVETWVGIDFPIFTDEGPPGVDFEAYTLATGFGRVRLFTLEEFEAANESGRFTFQDLVVVDEAPADVEGIVGGFITGTIQGPLSHVAVRTARRGTPNAFVADALKVFSKYEGKLVRLDVLPTEYSVMEASVSEAEEFWAANRPELPELPDFDPSYASFDELTEIDLDGEVNPVSRFGGKATNLARMQRLLTGEFEEYREEGFAIPMRYYLEFMRDNIRAEEGRELTYQEYLDELLSSAEFQSDSEVRFAALKEFRDFVRENGVVDPDLVARLVERIESVFGSRTRMVRFRSSSNTEDALEFNGAGLYESTSVCAADTVDPASPDSSHCDPLREEARTIERALKKVWSSLWTFRAHEERTFFQIPPEKGAMGILCNRAFLDEAANGVAFTGNPQNARDRRYVVTAQVGEESVVSPAPGIRVERNLLGIGEGGEVLRIIRDRASSLVGEGEVVLSDDQLRSLTRLLWHVDQTYPLNLEGHPREQVLMDFEFKVEPDGSLAVKQVRPFLIPDSAPPSPDFELVVPAGTVVCGVFSEELLGREPREEYETKSTVRFREGTQALPTGADSFSADIIEEVLFGPEQQMATPDAPGLFRVVALGGSGSETVYRFNYEQSFTLPGGERFDLKVLDLDLRGRGVVAVEKSLVLDDEYLTSVLNMRGSRAGEPVVDYSSCTYAQLPRWEVTVDLEDGSEITLVERFLPSEANLSTGPASLSRAVLDLEGAHRTVTDYWSLVYTARRHNVEVRYWVVLDPPLNLPSLSRPAHVVQIVAPEPPAILAAEVSYLDENFEPLGGPAVDRFNRRSAPEVDFRRGDVNADGQVDITDALAVLGFLFQRAEVPTCRKSVDADDNGKLNVTDGVTILLHLFGGQGPLASPGGCGLDPTADGLSCDSFMGCE